MQAAKSDYITVGVKYQHLKQSYTVEFKLSPLAKLSRKLFLYFRISQNVLANYFCSFAVRETFSLGGFTLSPFAKRSRKLFLYFRRSRNVLASCF